MYNNTIDLPEAVMLGGAHDGGSIVGLQWLYRVHLLQWAVGLQQQRRRRSFMLKSKVPA